MPQQPSVRNGARTRNSRVYRSTAEGLALALSLVSVFFSCSAVTIATTLAQSPDAPAFEKQQPAEAPAKPAAPVTKPRKVWTNDDFSSVRSGGSPASGTRGPSHGTFSNGAMFVSPQNGALVRPGELLHIEVSITPGKIIDGPIGIVSDLGFSNEIRESPPYSFTMTVSRKDNAGGGGRLIGKHLITAVGRVKGQEGYDLAAIYVDVEESDAPTKLSANGNMMSQYGPPGLGFFDAGAQQSLAISGNFPNGDEFDVTNSTYLKLFSGNPNVVSVGEEGMLTSLGPGTTSITATYTVGAQTMQISVPASVTVSTSGLIPTPLSLDFGNQPAGTASIPLQVILTNRSVSTITIYKFEIRAEIRESDNCTSAPLPPNGTCTISVTYVPYRAGPSRGIIYIPNSHSGQLSLPVSGNGI